MTSEYLTRVALFVAAIFAVQCAVDGYVLFAWRRRVQRLGWSRWWYFVPIALAVLMLPMFALTAYLRQTQAHPSQTNRILHYVVAAWYLPKVMIALAMFTRSGWLFVWSRFLEPSLRLLFSWVASKRIKKITRSEGVQDNKRREFLKTIGTLGAGAAASAPFVMVASSAWRLQSEFDVFRVDVPLRGLPRQFDGLTITQISDIHAGSLVSLQPIEEMRRIIESLRSDVLVVTGDWVNFRAREAALILPEIERLCTPKTAPLGVFGSLGNHDHYAHAYDLSDLMAGIRSTGTNLLVNQNHTIMLDGARLVIAGNDNVGLRQNYGDLQKTLHGLSAEAEYTTILMAHDPTLWDKQVRGRCTNGIRTDLMLSGHTHGGQFGVRALGHDFSPATFLYKQYAGLYADDGVNEGANNDTNAQQLNPQQFLYVNRGIGTTSIPVRIGIPPEITVLTLRRGQGKEKQCRK